MESLSSFLGGELGNSSVGTAAQADTILPAMARLHLNTVLVPVAWEQLEPAEGSFDFSILDHWIDAARQQNLHLVLLWFGSWKNAFSEYAPAWVKSDARRFPRALAADGTPPTRAIRDDNLPWSRISCESIGSGYTPLFDSVCCNRHRLQVYC
jgi:beta-galactosidase GanA